MSRSLWEVKVFHLGSRTLYSEPSESVLPGNSQRERLQALWCTRLVGLAYLGLLPALFSALLVGAPRRPHAERLLGIENNMWWATERKVQAPVISRNTLHFHAMHPDEMSFEMLRQKMTFNRPYYNVEPKA
jgi:hypothetical protein